jgi:regulator of sirC expression with transglutaminase-like and TPR domain
MIDPRIALDAVGQLPDAEIDIAEAALQLARIDAPDADWQAARRHLSALAREAVALAVGVPEDDIATRAGVLALLISARHGYAGDAEDYDNQRNANLIHVIERRRGLPVALGVIWLHAARAAGWAAHGIDFPGHFLFGLAGASPAVLDVFAGGTPLGTSALRRLIRSVEGPRAELRAGLLAPMSERAVLLRLQNNIKLRRLGAGDVTGALSCTEDMLRFAPEAAGLWREAGLLNQRLDQVAAALRCYERFLLLAPQGEAAAHTRTTVEQLRSRLN